MGDLKTLNELIPSTNGNYEAFDALGVEASKVKPEDAELLYLRSLQEIQSFYDTFFQEDLAGANKEYGITSEDIDTYESIEPEGMSAGDYMAWYKYDSTITTLQKYKAYISELQCELDGKGPAAATAIYAMNDWFLGVIPDIFDEASHEWLEELSEKHKKGYLLSISDAKRLMRELEVSDLLFDNNHLKSVYLFAWLGEYYEKKYGNVRIRED